MAKKDDMTMTTYGIIALGVAGGVALVWYLRQKAPATTTPAQTDYTKEKMVCRQRGWYWYKDACHKYTEAKLKSLYNAIQKKDRRIIGTLTPDEIIYIISEYEALYG